MEHTEENSYWIPMKETAVPACSWMLVDWHGNAEIVAGAGLDTLFSVGKCVGDRLDVDPLRVAQIEAALERGENGVRFLPFGGTWWFVFPQLYGSTGYVLFVRLSAPSEVVAALVRSGEMGKIVTEEALPSAAFPQIDSLSGQCLSAWRVITSCLPKEEAQVWMDPDGEKTLCEACRILCAAASLTGLRLHKTVTGTDWCQACRDMTVEWADFDFAMYSAMMLILASALARYGSGEWTVTPELSEEGVIFSMKASALRQAIQMRLSPELAYCRAMAERNCLLFDGNTRGRVFRGHLCANRKDFALLGIKDNPDKEMANDVF